MKFRGGQAPTAGSLDARGSAGGLLILSAQMEVGTFSFFFFFFSIRNKDIVIMDKKYKRRMGDPPHEIQESDKSMTKTPPLYKENYTKCLVH